jgi:hypothetical protein
MRDLASHGNPIGEPAEVKTPCHAGDIHVRGGLKAKNAGVRGCCEGRVFGEWVKAARLEWAGLCDVTSWTPPRDLPYLPLSLLARLGDSEVQVHSWLQQKQK